MFGRVALVVALAIWAAVVPAGGRAAPVGDAAYESLASRYFAEDFAADPPAATATGIHEYDAQLGSYGAADVAAQLTRDRRYLTALATVDARGLSPDVGLDRSMLMNALQDDLLLNGKMQLWRHKPDQYAQIASLAIYTLVERNFAPPSVRLRAVIARENQFPRLFAQARADLISVDEESATIALDDVQGSVGFLESDSRPHLPA